MSSQRQQIRLGAEVRMTKETDEFTKKKTAYSCLSKIPNHHLQKQHL